MNWRQLLLRGAGLVVVISLLALAGVYAWLLLSREPLNNPASRWLSWPVACTTRGCITTWQWLNYNEAAQRFSEVAQHEPPSSETVLTTLIRQHLAHYAHLRSPVTRADAVRYRQEILHGENEDQVREYTSFSLAEYDEQVLIPLLEQESLRQQRQAESPEDLYKQLAAERWVVVLPWFWQWDAASAQVTVR